MNNGLGHLYLGEFGIKSVDGADGRAMQWFESLLAYMGTVIPGPFGPSILTLVIPVAF